jgi:hypothetical protein
MDAPCIASAPHSASATARWWVACAAALLVLITTRPANALLIHFDAPGLAGGPALAALERAADTWEAVFRDPVTVNVTADLLTLGSASVIGQTSSVVLAAPHDVIRDAMEFDGLAESDDGVVAYLPRASEFSATVLGLAPGVVFGLTGNLSATKANLKALGFDAVSLDANFGAQDASMAFNADFPFDFDRSDGISPGFMDFETVAAHEIGHVLGFDSVVDTVDLLAAFGIVADLSPRTLDLFRFEQGNVPASPAEFTSAPRLLVPGFPDFSTFDDQFPAVFADLDNVFPLSTGFYLGDGRQASHWKDNDLGGSLVGMMDPTLSFGQSFTLSAADIRALDLIGWDFDPAVAEPPSVALVLAALLLLPLVTPIRRLAT